MPSTKRTIDTGPIRSVRRDPFVRPTDLPPVVKRSTVVSVPVTRNPKLDIGIKKAGRQKRRGLAK